MTRLGIMIDLHPFKGKKIVDCAKEIQRIAKYYSLTLNITDPEFNPSSIDKDDDRLNVKTDASGVIQSFTIG